MLTATINNHQSINNNKSFLPDINMHNPYYPKGISENQLIYKTKIQELIKENFEDKPINKQAIMNKHLKNQCNYLYKLIK